MLPEPWLPLKKGQALRNGSQAPKTDQESTQAVVLTLRKRYSSLRKDSRPLLAGARPAGYSATVDASRDRPISANSAAEEVTSINPWQDTRPGPSRMRSAPTQVTHRLSFDQASGVIMLPDEEDWIEEDEDSDEDYGNNLESSQILESPTSVGGDENGQGSTAPNSSKRYATYYHHPERRRVTSTLSMTRP